MSVIYERAVEAEIKALARDYAKAAWLSPHRDGVGARQPSSNAGSGSRLF
jgi:hypothetical protein